MAEETKTEVADVKQPESASTAQTPSVETPSTSENTQQTQTITAEKPESSEKKTEKSVPLHELIKERQRRRELEAELRSEIDKLKAQVNSNASDPIKEIATDLNVDEETARKLQKHFKPAQTQVNEEELLKQDFLKKANDVAGDYEDWDDLKQDMTQLLQAEYAKNPRMAFITHPESYYLKAKLQRSQKEKEASVKEVVEKSNSKNLATVESGKNSSPRPEMKPVRGSREWLKTLTQDEFEKEYSYIKTLKF